MRTRVKICCISSIQEAQTAIKHGADALGLVGPMPSGPGVLTDELIAQIVPIVPPPIATFLLTSETDAEAIITHHQRVYTNTIQIVDALSSGTYRQIRAALPNVRLVQVLHVLGEQTIDEAIEVAEQVDAILLDSGNPNLAIKELGGTGRTHNWQVSKRLVEAVNIPIFLAGGIRAENVREAIETVQPFGLDLCSSVRTSGKLDEWKLEAFFEAVYKVF